MIIVRLLKINQFTYVLPVVSKVFEKVIHKQILGYFLSNNLLSDCLYGFRPKHSTEQAALYLYNDILHQLDLGKILYY